MTPACFLWDRGRKNYKTYSSLNIRHAPKKVMTCNPLIIHDYSNSLTLKTMFHLYLIIEFMAKASWLSNHIQSHNQWEISSSYEIYILDKINCAFETSCRVNEISNVVPNLMTLSFLSKIYSRSTDRVPKILGSFVQFLGGIITKQKSFIM